MSQLPTSLQECVFDAIYDNLEEPGGSDALLKSLCSAHPDLAKEIEAYATELRRHIDAIVTPHQGRYHSLDEIGQGGVGVVRRGYDSVLGRPVALKFLREQHRENAGHRARFISEARIGGRLQHPGTVPVFDIDPDEPFFAMKLVDGSTLAKLLDARKDVGDELSRFLLIFRSVAQTIAYAHSRGVIHRDIKPHNVIVGDFGEVLVIDWGLGKIVQEGLDTVGEPSGHIASHAVQPLDLSRSGDAMGTPAYMPPEQARGEIDAIEFPADVFCLGAVLCEILTGEPPYVSHLPRVEARLDDLKAQARDARIENASVKLAACGCDPALAQLALRCLSADSAARPTAAEVAECIDEYALTVEQRARKADLRARTERQRRRHVSVISAVILCAVAISMWLYSSRSIAAEKSRVRTTQLRTFAEGVLDFHDEVRAFAGTLAARQSVLNMTINALRELEAEPGAAKSARTLSRGYNRAAAAQVSLASLSEAVASYEAALRHASRVENAQLRYEQEWIAHRGLARTYLMLQDFDSSERHAKTAERQARAMLARSASDQAARIDASSALIARGLVEEERKNANAAVKALNLYLEAKNLAEEGSDDAQIDLMRHQAKCLSCVGDAYLRQGRVQDALQHFDQAVAVCRKARVEAPENGPVVYQLSVHLQDKGRAHEDERRNKAARAAYQEALRLARGLHETEPLNAQYEHHLAISLEKLGAIASGTSAGQALLNEAVGRYESLAARFPNNPGFHRGAFFGHFILSKALVEKQPDHAAISADRARAVAELVQERWPSADAELNLVAARQLYAVCREALRDFGGAYRAQRKVLEAIEAIHAREPEDPQWEWNLANSFLSLGSLQVELKRAGAVKDLSRGIEVAEGLVRKKPEYIAGSEILAQLYAAKATALRAKAQSLPSRTELTEQAKTFEARALRLLNERAKHGRLPDKLAGLREMLKK